VIAPRPVGFAAIALAAALLSCTSRTKASLGEALAVEQPGDAVALLLSQGVELPTSATEGFTNGKDDERKLFIHVLRGAGKTASKLHSDGWYSVDGVTAAKAGQARVMVTFDVDAQGALKVTAREEDRKLSVHKLDANPDRKPNPAPLTEQDDGSDLEDDSN
jgi:molecular chaperone DnaK (HSP70)